ncbi:MAG: dTDP-4-dehydrorhamnose reductase [Gemmatales bacterium]|nr:dTDP-4-dehydrorhamnose reductase [Gemmatales bacterium]MDW8386662.1 dTDP-4-dehydrorhamnose reductase [Gemmatales bacterium]
MSDAVHYRYRLDGKIAVLGSAGQLGREILARLDGDVTPWTRKDADLTDAESLSQVIHRLKPSIVINCAAYNFVDRAESEPQAAFAVNAFAPRTLADLARQMGFLLVHFSTDYVFGLDANRAIPYRESDAPGPISVYGTSKLAGEFFIRSMAPQHLVIRTCGLYGRWGSGGKGTNFVETMLRLAGEGKPIRVVNDQVLTPTAAADVADACLRMIQDGVRGLRHLTNSGQCSWYEFARAIFEIAAVTANLSPTDSASYGAAAPRPTYSVLVSEYKDTPKLRPWREALAAYLTERLR